MYGEIRRQHPRSPQSGHPPRKTGSQSIFPVLNASSYSNTEEKLLSYTSWIHCIRRPGDSSCNLGSPNFSATGQFFLVPRVQCSADRLDIPSLNNLALPADFSAFLCADQHRTGTEANGRVKRIVLFSVRSNYIQNKYIQNTVPIG